MSIPIPTTDASTFEGQVAWFLAGFGYASVVFSVGFMIRLFRQSAGGGNHENGS